MRPPSPPLPDRAGPAGRWWDRWWAPRVAEYLDDPAVCDAKKSSVIHGLGRFNDLSLTTWRLTRWALALVPPVPARPRVVELGAGGGRLAASVARALVRRGTPGWVVASDVAETYARRLGQDAALRGLGVPAAALDATRLGLADRAFHLALFAMGLHHLEPAQVVDLLQEGTRVADRLLVVDGWRHPAMLAISPAFLVLGNGPAFRDGVVSLQRMYAAEALRDLAARAGVTAQVDYVFPGHLRCVARRP